MLLTAEKDYSSTGEDEHSLSTWDDRIKEPEVSDAYDNTDSTTNIEAWNISNAGVNDSSDVLSSTDSGEESVFQGGFHGECEEGEIWQYTEDEEEEEFEWRCSGDIPWDQPVLLPETDGDFIGLVVPHTNLMTQDDLLESDQWTDFESFPIAVESVDNADGWGEMETLDAECWVGGTDQDDELSEDEKSAVPLTSTRRVRSVSTARSTSPGTRSTAVNGPTKPIWRKQFQQSARSSKCNGKTATSQRRRY